MSPKTPKDRRTPLQKQMDALNAERRKAAFGIAALTAMKRGTLTRRKRLGLSTRGGNL